MPTFTVENAYHKKAVPDAGHGPKQVIALLLKNGDGALKEAEWFTNASTAVPAKGSTLDGELTVGKYGLSFKKVSGGGGPRPEDPKRAAVILRQHSQEMALRWMAIQAQRGLVDEEFTYDGLTNVIDWFDQDAKKARDAA